MATSSKNDPLAKRGRRRRKAIEELLTTEKTYVNLMTKLVHHYVDELRSNTSILPTADYKILFPADLHAIVGLNQTFLQELTSRMEAESWSNWYSKIGDIISAFSPHFKMYQSFANNYGVMARHLAQLRQQKSSSPFCKFCQKQSVHFNTLTLEQLLILPIQRMPRYKILLEEILKYTEVSHPDHKLLNKALAQICQVNHIINNRIKEFESRNEVQNIENLLIFKGKNKQKLVTPSRRFIKKGEMCKLFMNNDEIYYLFILFNDCIVYAKTCESGNNLLPFEFDSNFVDNLLQLPLTIASSNKNKLIFGNLLLFDSNFSIQKTDSSVNVHNMEHLFEIHSSAESLMLYTETVQQMEDWIEVIQHTFTEYVLKTGVNKMDNINVFAATLYIPDSFADVCMMVWCKTKFNFVNRRHHCNYCGLVVCGDCSKKKLRCRLSDEKVRVCIVCFENDKKAKPKRIKVLTNELKLETVSKEIIEVNDDEKIEIKPKVLNEMSGIDPKELTEAVECIEEFLDVNFAKVNDENTGLVVYDENNFFGQLKDGLILCELLNKIENGTCKDYKASKIAYVQRVNITIFINGCRKLGISETNLFDTNDLFEEKRLSAVLKCIFAVRVKATQILKKNNTK